MTHPRFLVTPHLREMNTTIPSDDLLYIGIDIAKRTSVAGFVSNSLLSRYGRFEVCPSVVFEQSRPGYQKLLQEIQCYASLAQCCILMEFTGHYHKALEQFLLEQEIPVYLIHAQERMSSMMKTDKRDALGLANHLYNQLEKNIQVAEKKQLARQVRSDTEAAAQLRRLIQHHTELMRESTRRKNKLTAICDELFPELRQVFKDPNGNIPLRYREVFSTPQELARAPMNALIELRRGKTKPSNKQLFLLQELALQSIGIKEGYRQKGLIFEQKLLIQELHAIQQNLTVIEAEITSIVTSSREGKILLSIPCIGIISAATLIASIGNIANFETPGHLKSYLGWAPVVEQTGTTIDKTKHSNGGGRIPKSLLYMLAGRVVAQNTEWTIIYRRLVKRKCSYDERRKRYVGTKKVIGRIAGQMIKLIYLLLKTDQEALSNLPPSAPLPKPMLYDPALHKKHREGGYQPYQKLSPKELSLLRRGIEIDSTLQ